MTDVKKGEAFIKCRTDREENFVPDKMTIQNVSQIAGKQGRKTGGGGLFNLSGENFAAEASKNLTGGKVCA